MNDETLVLIRPAAANDARDILDVYTPYVTDSATSFEEEPPSVQEMSERIARSHVWLVAEDAGHILGYAYATRFHPRAAYRWSVQISIYLAPEAQGRGVGKLLLRELLDRLVAAGLVNAFAGTTLPNVRSIALFESFGFEKIAHQKAVGFKLGEWHDVGWWQLQLQEPSSPPPTLS